jgi:ribosomal protein S18 acetylase RimI-like enzyme
MTIKSNNALKEPQRIDIASGKIQIFTRKTIPPSELLLNKHSRTFMQGFNKPPWDVYEWKYTPEKAAKEFAKIIFTVLKGEGALLSLEYNGEPAGFNIVTDLGIFVQRLGEVEKFKRLPQDFKNPRQYFISLSKLINIPESGFGKVGYMADVVVDSALAGRGFGKSLAKAAIEYLKSTGRQDILAWTVNPVMAGILKNDGFNHIDGIGDKGEGIDFLVQGKVWYPTLDLPAKGRTTLAGMPVIAEHYFLLNPLRAS